MLAFLEGPDLLVVLALVVLLFGGSKIPQLARSLGEAQREFRKAAQPDVPAPPAAEPPPEGPATTGSGAAPTVPDAAPTDDDPCS
jgi:sec-independent protein translocase protein TatA